MSKLYTKFLLLLVYVACMNGSAVMAQEPLNGPLSPSIDATLSPVRYSLHHTVNDSRAVTGRWLDYWFVQDSIASEQGLVPALYYAALFPDSDAIICTLPGPCGRSVVHLMGTVLDPSSADMQYYLQYSWSKTDPYWVDSLAIYYNYLRNSDPSVVDTLLVYLVNNDSVSTLPVHYYTGFSANYGYDTVRFALIRYDSTGTNRPDPFPSSVMEVIKVPLTDADIGIPGVNIKTKTIYANHFPVAGGGLVGAVFGFKPGYSYALSDTAQNSFYFYSSMPNGTNTYITYVPDDWNVSQIVTRNGRYQQSPNEFNRLFMPTYSFLLGYQLQEHLVSYYISGTFDVGVKENNSSSGLKVFQNEPNPANQTTLVRYELAAGAAVLLEVHDVTGRIVAQRNEGMQTAGRHVAVIDISSLSTGLYTYTLKAGDESQTRRLIISE